MNTDHSEHSLSLSEAPPHRHPEHPDRGNRSRSFRKLSWAFFICLIFMAAEFVGAWVSHSLVLLADAFHMMTDALSLGIALLAMFLSHRLQSKKSTFGFYRLEILAAFLNGFLLLMMSGFIFIEAIQRFFSPQEIHAQVMILVGAFGLLANLTMIFIMHGSHRENLNLKGAFFHVLGDTLASIGVIVGAICILYFDSSTPDSIVSLLIATLIAVMALKLLRDSGQVLMERTPENLDPSQVVSRLKNTFPQIQSIHDFHFWQITSELFAMTAHIDAQVSDLVESRKLIDAMNVFIQKEYGITHTTFQIEPAQKNHKP